MIEGLALQLPELTGGKLAQGNPNATFRGVSIDSRTVAEGNLFFCIEGDRFDGHEFIQEAISKMAAGIVLSKDRLIPPLSTGPSGSENPFVILVDDTLLALQTLAQNRRQQSNATVVAITGTNGKSTTKEMLAAIAGAEFKTLKSRGNFNNQIGLPLTLMELADEHEVAILEMGMSASGEIRRLAEIARPNIGLITNISEAHLEELKTIENVQAAKGELFEALSEQDTAVVNADDPLVADLAKRLRASSITYSAKEQTDVWAENIRARTPVGYDFTLNIAGQKLDLSLPFPGQCNIQNAVAAFAAASALGMQPEAMHEGFKTYQAPPQRQEMIEWNEILFINDSYNANPQSMREALDTLKNFKAKGKRIFVMGEMLELAERSQDAHEQIGRDVAENQIDLFITTGEIPAMAAQSAITSGMDASQVIASANVAGAVELLKLLIAPGDCVLVKGSRGARMERVIEAFLNKNGS